MTDMSEAEFARQLENLFNIYGWTWHHARPARMQSGKWATAQGGRKGFPDYIAVKRGIVLAIEIKSPTGTASPDQLHWLNEFDDHARFWRPQDLPEIRDELSRPLRDGEIEHHWMAHDWN